MPRSHICPSCLTELARIRAAPDPHYGLGVVVCPSCEAACVRTQHPDIQFWRNFRRLHQSIRLVIFKVLLSIGLGALMFGLVMWGREFDSSNFQSIDPGRQFGAWATAILIPALACGSGCVIRLVYRHKHAIVPFLALIIFGVFFTWVDYIFMGLTLMMSKIGGFDFSYHTWSANDFIQRALLFAFVIACAFIGFLPARFLSPFMSRSPNRKFRKLRRKRLKSVKRSD